jgi:TPR repeat protein
MFVRRRSPNLFTLENLRWPRMTSGHLRIGGMAVGVAASIAAAVFAVRHFDAPDTNPTAPRQPLAAQDPDAAYRQALDLRQAGNYAEAARLLKEVGTPAADFYLALLYANGQGVAQDNAQAVTLLTRASDKGDPRAQTALGMRYAAGDGVPQDASAAAAWYSKAAHQGYVLAQMLIGLAHATGQGVEQNYVQADTWLVLAAAAGHADAAEERDNIELLLTDDEVRQATERANALAEQIMAAGKL